MSFGLPIIVDDKAGVLRKQSEGQLFYFFSGAKSPVLSTHHREKEKKVHVRPRERIESILLIVSFPPTFSSQGRGPLEVQSLILIDSLLYIWLGFGYENMKNENHATRLHTPKKPQNLDE